MENEAGISSSINPLAVAMESVKQASAQNVASSKQAETAAKDLHQLGQKLKQMVAQYKVQMGRDEFSWRQLKSPIRKGQRQ